MPSSDSDKDCSNLTDDELVGILERINREKYPERYQQVRDEFVRRFGAKVDGISVDDHFDQARLRRPFVERKLFKRAWLLLLLGWALLMGLVRLILYLAS